MKSETPEIDRTKIESRQSIHRRKMSKNTSVVNGADESPTSYAVEDESVVRQINLAAAFHDHISCTKSAELCKIDGSREPRVSLPCETDHIYANCGDKKNKSPIVVNTNNPPVSPNTANLARENKRMRNMLVIQLELIKHLEADLAQKRQVIRKLNIGSESFLSHIERKERIRNYLKSEDESIDVINISPSKGTESETKNTLSTVTSTTADCSSFAVPQANEYSISISPLNLVTRYIGRNAGTIPSRALKRRILGPPKKKPVSFKIPTAPVSVSSATSVSSESEVHEDEMVPKVEVPKESKLTRAKTSLVEIKRVGKRRGKRPKVISKRQDCLMTTKDYYLPDNQKSPPPSVDKIDVPLWEVRPVSSFYQMEGTENINDTVFHRRHSKCEQDERRRKRWDIQRLREQKASEKLKYKYCRDTEKESDSNVQQKVRSFFPDPHNIHFLHIAEEVPVVAFGQPIPLFQPSDFSLPLKSHELPAPTETPPAVKVTKKGRPPLSGPKVT